MGFMFFLPIHGFTCKVFVPLEDRKLSPLPQKLRLDPALRVVSITSGPLAHHSFLLMQRLAGRNGYGNGYGNGCSNGSGRDLSPRLEGWVQRHQGDLQCKSTSSVANQWDAQLLSENKQMIADGDFHALLLLAIQP